MAIPVSDSGWTPGPWAIDIGGLEYGVSAVTVGNDGMYERRSAVVILGGEHPCGGGKDWDADNWLADARLIALAPEMADAILKMEGAILAHPHPDGPEEATELLLTVATKLREIRGNA
jgi:hypothetical protein